MPEKYPFLKGKRVSLHALVPEDAEDCLRWMSDPEVRRFLKVNEPLTKAEEHAWLVKLPERKKTDIVLGLVTAEGKYIGNMGLHRINREQQTAGTGSVIGEKDHWSKGYGQEAKMLLLHYAFHDLPLRRITSRVYDFNGRSRRCLEKCGYKHEGTLRQEMWRDGRWIDTHLFAALKEDWLPLWEEFEKTRLV